MEEKFAKEATYDDSKKWNNCIKREAKLYKRENEIRSEFERDYNRIIHSLAYRRLKHKTQVFFSPSNDHICTRIEHVNYVESISSTIAKSLGLNIELTRAIGASHDIGHSPFGHKGEKVLSEISQQEIGKSFWHEKNGLNFVDNIELLEDEQGNKKNLNLTYAVRDGIISHCGEIDENCLRPREEYINLEEYKHPNQFAPYTWEACVVKISDKISYICRDIEDAITLKILNKETLKELEEIYKKYNRKVINNTTLIHELINDLYENSSLEKGLTFSNENFKLLNELKKFNYKNIYLNKKIEPSDRYFKIVLTEIFNKLKEGYEKEKTENKLEEMKYDYPELFSEFLEWIKNYWDLGNNSYNKNKIIYKISQDENEYKKAIIDYMSGMTDNYAIKMYEHIISF